MGISGWRICVIFSIREKGMRRVNPTGPNDQRRWYVSQGAQRYGPYQTQGLVDWIATGRVARGAMVSDGGPWGSAGEMLIIEARAATSAAPPPPPPPVHA